MDDDGITAGNEKKNGSGKGLKVLYTVAFLGLLLILLKLILELTNLVLLSGDVFDAAYETVFPVRVAIPSPTEIFSVTGSGLQVYWTVLAAVVFACCALTLWHSKDGLVIRRSSDITEPKHTEMLGIAIAMCALLSLQMILMAVSSSVFGTIDDPDQEKSVAETLLGSLNAGVLEELNIRLLMIGAPMAVIAALYRRKDCLRNLFGGFGMSWAALVLIILSSLVFGYAHVDRWGWARFPDTVLMGLALGYLYTRFGLHVTIMVHFMWDFDVGLANGIGAGLLGPLYTFQLLIGFACIVLVAVLAWKQKDGVHSIPRTGFERTA